MPRKSLKNRKLSPWVTEAVKHWRWQQDRLHPLFEVTSPKYSGAWMDEVETQYRLISLAETLKALRLEQEANRERQTEQSVPSVPRRR